MKAYELMLMIDPSLDEEAQAALLERVSGVIKSDGGVVDSTEAWGRRRLAFEINNLTDADYTVVQFHAPAANVAELDRVLHITDTVVRFMIVRRDDLS
jgi:small subunit ribosomal protein S6